MPKKFKREDRYQVLKSKDIHAALSEDERLILEILAEKVARQRVHRDAPVLQCVVVESGWPEYEPTWAAIEKANH